MKYMIYLLAAMYIIWWFVFIKFFMAPESIDIVSIKNSTVIIIPEEKLISYKDNPKWLFKENKNSWVWAWFFINKQWEIQTVNHIIENEDINYKIIYKNKEYNSKIINRDKENDLAIVKILNIENQEISFLEKSKDISENESVFSFWVDSEKLEIIYNTWVLINKKSKLDDKSNLLEISNKIKPGFSGWPIINSKWKVIWINYAISEWKSYWIKF